MKKSFFQALCAFFIVMIIVGCAVNQQYTEEELGLRQTNIYSEDDVKLISTQYSIVEAGESVVFDRAFENAPPMISHSVEDMLPITKDNNMCLTCHDRSVAADMQATSMPDSHYFDLRNDVALDEVSQSRFNCSACHAPQADAKPLVGNNFRADFRNKDGLKQSNLLDVLNEGI